jgi:hypothetical protein
MLATTSGQVGFFDAVELVGPLPEGSFFALLAEHGDRIMRDEDFSACYSRGIGRPSIPPSQLAKVLLLQYRTGASDEAAMEAIAWDHRLHADARRGRDAGHRPARPPRRPQAPRAGGRGRAPRPLKCNQ